MGSISLVILFVSIIAGLDKDKLELIMQVLAVLSINDYITAVVFAVIICILLAILWLGYRYIKGYGDYLESRGRENKTELNNEDKK
ncbi:MAG: hypothetical protein FWE18_03275 [Alphaproteobacteria bacterium]|nr:hypothetical protein [Alphaproteobacteria bacterium]